ncbi:LPXTG cell wall anchor domain-containing protein [Cellulomonas humilata]|uniref:LPXTG cell wall anchor domain-containing protein n=1 Tax=Cellulomonas humilata TaxID=144055 RepID=A0A7Y6DYH8_9CELL|nr:LPXTG cell wall anchor domain-containing protein [Cellulomonas humilata]NUU18082.1 LPXTG cell wall anchor domain-containing protein [Cellulomonas humilata]
MQRSVRPSPISSRRLGRHARAVGAVVGVTALLGALGGGVAQAHDRDGRSGARTQSTAQTPKPTVTTTAKPTVAPTQSGQQTTGAYVYLKKDAKKDASWPNSTQQYLVTTWPDASWRDLTLAEVVAALPAGTTVCGDGWGVQEDQAWGDATVFTGSKAPSYPKDFIGWVQNGGPIFDAKHWDLTDMVTVPACGPAPTTSPSATPTVSPSPTPTPSQSVPAPTVPTVPVPSETPTTPAPSVPPVAEVDDSPAPTTPPTAGLVASTPSPSASFYSEVLAAGPTGGAALAATGSSPLPGLLAGGILVLSGAALLLLRRRHAS